MASFDDSYAEPLCTSMHKINMMLHKLNMIGTGVVLPGDSDANYLKHLGFTEKALSSYITDTDRAGFRLVNATPGKFMFYLDRDVPNGSYTLVQCLSGCNSANECYILHVRIKSCKIDRDKLGEFRLTDIGEDADGYSLPGKTDNIIHSAEIDPDNLKVGNVVVSNEPPKRLLVLKKQDPQKKNFKFTEYFTEVQTIRVHRDTCHFLTAGNTESLARGHYSMSPPTRFVDDGMYMDKELPAFNACKCTFLAMYQREVSTGDTQLSIKRYFNNAPNITQRIDWKVYAGRIDGDRFTENVAILWIDDRYQSSRLSIDPKISGGLVKHEGNHAHIFINIFIVLHHWARHDAIKGVDADTLLWKSDQTYSPYDSFYKKSFDAADQTLLRTYDFTITQCLRNWVYGILDALQNNGAEWDDGTAGWGPDDDREDMTTHTPFNEIMMRQMLRDGVEELNTMLSGTGQQLHPRSGLFAGLFATPITAAHDNTLSDEMLADYTARAGIIMQHAFTAAFPSFTHVGVDGVVNVEKFLSHIMTIYQTPQMRQLSNLQLISAGALAGNYFTNDSDVYNILETFERHPILFPSDLKRGDLLFIYDSEGVRIAYFHAFRWIDKKDSLLLELDHYDQTHAEESQQDDAFMLTHTWGLREAARDPGQVSEANRLIRMLKSDHKRDQAYIRDLANRLRDQIRDGSENAHSLVPAARAAEISIKKTNELYRKKAFQYWIPIIDYTLVKGQPPSRDDMYVRDIFNVYTVSARANEK